VDDGGVRGKVVVAEGFGFGPEEEAKGELGFVLEVEGNLGKLKGVYAVGARRSEIAPP